MEKRYFSAYFISALLIAFLLICPVALAAIEIEKETIAGTIIKEFATPAVFNLTIKNDNIYTDYFKIDSQLDIILQPSGSFKIDGHSKKNLLLKVYFGERAREYYGGISSFAYYIKGQTTGIKEDKLNINIMSLKKAADFDIPSSMGIRDKKLEIILENKADVLLDITTTIQSDLFENIVETPLTPYEKREIIIDLDAEKIWKEAGTYPITITLSANNEDYELEFDKEIELEELEEITADEKDLNLLFYRKTTISKTNTGNIPKEVSTTLKMRNFAKAFTSFNIEPTSIKEEKSQYVLTWEKELKLGEALIVKSRTNFSTPLLIIIVLGALGFLYFNYTNTEITIRKKIKKAKSRTGEFVAKVVLTIGNHGKMDVSNIKLTDNLPVFTSIHERFGAVKPDKIDKKSLTWNINRLAPREQKTFSYVIYSKIRVIGRHTLPPAEAEYSIGDKDKKAKSNRVHIIS